MGSVLENYNELNKILSGSKAIFSSRSVKSIAFTTKPYFLQKLTDHIESAEERFSRQYQNGYHHPLKNGLKDIISHLIEPTRDLRGTVIGIEPKRYVFLTLLVQAAIQRNEPRLQPTIQIAQAILDNLFQTYKSKRQQLGIASSLTHQLPPLVGFFGKLPDTVSALPPLPTTLGVAMLQEYLDKTLVKDFSAGAIGLPAGFMTHPLLWSVTAHEAGGHYILSSTDTLLPELQHKLYQYMSREYPNPPLNALAPLWRFWTEEAASDVCAALTLGPSAGIVGLSWYTALFALAWGPEQGTKLTCTYNDEDWHPISILIPDLICGAINELTSLATSRRIRYRAQIEEIAQSHSDIQSHVEFETNAIVRDPSDFFNTAKFTKLPKSLILKEMTESARAAGRFIASVKLDALSGNSLKDLAQWTDETELEALEVASLITDPKAHQTLTRNNPKPLPLISGGILAVVRQPHSFSKVNKALLNVFKEVLPGP